MVYSPKWSILGWNSCRNKIFFICETLNDKVLNLRNLLFKTDDIDNSSYSYNGNRLSQITDGVGGSHEVDFVQRGGTNYTYWPDGSLKSDANEQIQNINYDTFLRQPTQVQLTDARTINYYYDGGGKLLKTVYSTGEIWEFGNGLIYKNGQPYQMSMPEGRATYQNGTWQNEFFHTDHLGNTRVSFKANGTQLEKTAETAFDPWGVVLNGIGQQNAFQNRFEMQGKESEKTFGLNRINLGARNINPTTGIFDRSDVLADHPNQLRFSPYSAFWNNPVLYTDPDGNCPSCPQGEDAAKVYSAGATVTNKDGSWTWTGNEWQTNQPTQLSDRQVASVMPVNMAFGMGAYAGLQQTGQFLGSLTTAQGWRDLGQGFVNMAKIGNQFSPEGIMMRAEMIMAVDAYAENIPDMTAGEIAYDLGYGSEKVAEAVLTRKAMPILKSSLGLPKGLGPATPYTNSFSLALKNSMGRSSFKVPTLVGTKIRYTRDIGLITSRNLLTPLGYTTGVGQFQYIQRKK